LERAQKRLKPSFGFSKKVQLLPPLNQFEVYQFNEYFNESALVSPRQSDSGSSFGSISSRSNDSEDSVYTDNWHQNGKLENKISTQSNNSEELTYTGGNVFQNVKLEKSMASESNDSEDSAQTTDSFSLLRMMEEVEFEDFPYFSNPKDDVESYQEILNCLAAGF
jgi:hypothetical protein